MSAATLYLVLCDGHPLRLETDRHDLPAGGVLIAGGSGTLFRTQAHGSICRKKGHPQLDHS
ncbi:MAG: hypothetical protein WCB68_17540 [Pyrinomonadaceae bacterium]